MDDGYDSLVFKMYTSLEEERARFEEIINAPRDFLGDETAEREFYERAVYDYISRIRDIID